MDTYNYISIYTTDIHTTTCVFTLGLYLQSEKYLWNMLY